MSDPMDRLSAADPELGRSVPPTPSFAAPEAPPLLAGPLRAVLVAAAVVLAVGIPVWLLGGGGGDAVAPVSTPTSEPTATPSTVAPTTAATDAADEPTTTVAPTTSVAWEGEPFDFWVPVPEEGPILVVVGVRYDDTLNVRAGPGTQFGVVGELDPTEDGLAGTGAGWQLPGGDVWWELEGLGWVNQRYVARLGPTDDITSVVLAAPGFVAEAPTLEELAMQVAAVRGDTSRPPDEWFRVPTLSVAPTEGDLGEVTIDVLGYADDSVAGERLHVFAVPVDGGWTLRSVEATTFCQRGVDSAADVCV